MLIKLSDNLTGRIFVSYIFSAARHKLYMVGVGCVLFVMYLISCMYLGVHNNMGGWAIKHKRVKIMKILK